MTNYTLYRGDCLDVMSALKEHSVDAVIADPPYGTTACKWDSVIPFAPMWDGIKRVTKERAAVALFGAQPFTSALVMSNPKWYRTQWVWRKNQSTGFLNAKKYPLKAHEDIIVFGGLPPNYYPIKTTGHKERKRVRRITRSAPHYGSQSDTVYCSTEKYPNTILEFDTVKNTQFLHPTQKPVALLEYLIKTYTNPGDTVLDFTMGSGTTGVAAMHTGRNFIGIELDSVYFAVAEERIAKAKRMADGEMIPINGKGNYADLPLFKKS